MKLHAIKRFYSAEAGGLVELEDDVLSVVSQVRQLTDGRISVNLDPVTGYYHLVEHCEDHTDRLVFSTDSLDARVVDRIMRADSQRSGYENPYDASERAQDEAQAAIDHAKTEQMLEHGEELLFHLKREGRAPRMPTQVFIPGGQDA